MMYIKAWDENSNTMIEDIVTLHQRRIITDFSSISNIDNIKLTWLFPAGVKDINKKEGYLGDILKEPISEYSKERVKKSFGIIKKEHNSNNLYIEWNFIKLFEGEECWFTNNLPITHIDRYEIKGNVFENPEMIKKE